MIEIHRSALVLVAAENLYQLINDIEAYPQFLDGVKAARIIEQSETEMLGELIVSKAGIERRLLTRNTLAPNETIKMSLEDGPLDFLEGCWTISALNETGCKVHLDLTFSSAKGLKGLAFNRAFKQIADSMVDAFVTRAHQLFP